VQRSDAVHPPARHRREVRHAHRLLAALVDERHALHAPLVAREPRAHVFEEAAVDLVDDLEVPRQHAPEERQGPRLERLRQERVVRVGERSRGDGPGVVPAEPVDVHQETHQLGHRHRRVRVVQLHGVLLAEVVDGRLLEQQADAVLQRARDEEVLLLEAQPLAREARVVRVEDLGDVLAAHLLFDGARVLADLERAEIELLGRDRAP
jgi:hypothetical protein